jgi:hypothetical protein
VRAAMRRDGREITRHKLVGLGQGMAMRPKSRTSAESWYIRRADAAAEARA